MPEGRATLALESARAVRRLLVAVAAPSLLLVVLGCSPAVSALREGSGGGSSSSSNHEDGSGGGADGLLFVISGFDLGGIGGSSGGGAPGAGAEERWGSSAAIGTETLLSGQVGGSTSDSASAPTSSATTEAGYGDIVGPCDPDEIIDTSPAVPELLSATGLYQSMATKTVAANVLPFVPLFPLWSDGAEKRRWVRLPGCAKIDTSEMDRWEVPVGTKIWKEFVSGGARVETRYLHRWGPGPNDYVLQAYQWNEDATDATPVPIGGVKDANGTLHDIPGAWECEVCHGHSPERVLGLSAIQLSHTEPGVTIGWLSAAGRLTVPSWGFRVPGDATARAALGYLHGNCAHCHNPSPRAVSFPTPFSLKLLTAAASVAETDAFLTAVGVATEKFVHPGITHRITAGDPASSGVAYRMSVRGSTDEMPALGSELVDPDGLAVITAWITTLRP